MVDTFEPANGVPAQLEALGVKVERVKLPVGDYDLGCGVLVERKTVADLHSSLGQGRLWGQIGRLRASAKLPYLLVEGRDLDAGRVPAGAIRGACLGVIGQGVALIRSTDAADSALWLRILAARRGGVRLGRDRPVYAQRLKPAPDLVREAMLASVPGISVNSARALLDHFGSVSAVVAADEQQWAEVRGVGPKRAAALREAIS
ncbi:MAG TPA: ERCC4 domain-containing protein [Gaiellaceae bacterium]|nr:ERCC4 domain-containing protein [Gaiellaceae bacterium]